jgi:diguanylate cyclase (GGDEF)-like protein
MSSYRTSTSTAQLHRLLALTRDLLQVSDFQSALELIGAAICDVLASDGTLLLVSMGGHEYRIEFDHHGKVKATSAASSLFQYARQAMESERIVSLNTDNAELPDILAVNFPPVKPIGALLIFWNKNKREGFLAKRISLLQQLAELIAASIGNLDLRSGLERQVSAQTDEIAEINQEHAQEIKRRDYLEAEMHRISTTDAMTGLKNRRGFFLQAEQSFLVAKRRKTVSAVIYADVDGLKAVNDELGHDVGDQLIRDSARIFQEAFRASDVVARLGGDEFVAFTFDATQPEAILTRIRENIETFNRNSSRPYQVAFSTGIAQCDPASGFSLPDYLVMADKEMYAQKLKQHASRHAVPVLFQPVLPRR